MGLLLCRAYIQCNLFFFCLFEGPAVTIEGSPVAYDAFAECRGFASKSMRSQLMRLLHIIVIEKKNKVHSPQ